MIIKMNTDIMFCTNKYCPKRTVCARGKNLKPNKKMFVSYQNFEWTKDKGCDFFKHKPIY